jgi:GNAT superfamily N-acetyltransferase
MWTRNDQVTKVRRTDHVAHLIVCRRAPEHTEPVSNDVYELDDDPQRVDRAIVSHFLTTEAYWGRWRGRAEIERQLETAWRLIGAYERATGAMVGFARAVSDGVAMGYLADVFVLRAHRGRGLGERLVAAIVDDGPGATMRWMLHTADAHDLYARHGFRPPDSTYLERPAPPAWGSLTR